MVIDGLPVVPEDSKGKLVKYLLKKLTSVGKPKEDATYMPLNDEGKTEGYEPVPCLILELTLRL